MLDTAECGLSQDVCAAGLVVLGDVVQDLERRTSWIAKSDCDNPLYHKNYTSQIEIYMIVGALADRR